MAETYDSLMEELLKEPCMILDILPEQVPPDAGERYFAVEKYFRRPERLGNLYRKFAEILLRLNCYDDMAVSFDGGETWERNPDPEALAGNLVRMSPDCFFRAVFESGRSMIDLDAGDTYMTFYGPGGTFRDRLRMLAEAEGLFFRPGVGP